MSTVDADRDYQVQLALLSQQNKKRTGEAPNPAWKTAGLDGRVTNLFTDGSLLCHSCLGALWSTDNSLLADLSDHVHLPVPEASKCGPDLSQCFCGYFCFDAAKLEAHFEQRPRDSGLVTGLLQRIEKLDLHASCRKKLVDALH